jgi:hypothetical protein
LEGTYFHCSLELELVFVRARAEKGLIKIGFPRFSGLEGEGWFDPWLLVKALKQKNLSFGVKYVHGEVEGFEYNVSDEYEASQPQKQLASARVSERNTGLSACVYLFVWAFI